jgi:hypothetical protein
MEEKPSEFIKSLDFEKFWGSISSTATRLGHNSLDEKWLEVKEVIKIAWSNFIQTDPSGQVWDIGLKPKKENSPDIPIEESNPDQHINTLNLSIRLLRCQNKQLIPWGSIIARNEEFAVCIYNPSKTDKMRIVCHVCDSTDRRKSIEGKLVLNLDESESAVMLKFKTDDPHDKTPLQLHFLATILPLIPGRALFHTRLFVNVEKPVLEDSEKSLIFS